MKPKWRRIREGLKERGLDGALILSPENLHYATGYACHQHTVSRKPEMASVVIPTAEALEPLLICMDFEHPTVVEKVEGIPTRAYDSWVGVREYEDIAERREAGQEKKPFSSSMDVLVRSVRETGLASGKLGIEEDFVPLQYHALLKERLPEVSFVDISDMLIFARSVKTPEEIDMFRRLTEVADEALLEASRHVRPGATEKDVAQVFRRRAIESGICVPSAWSTFNTGPNSSMLRLPGDRTIQEGDLFKFDGGVNAEFDFYTTDTSRTWIVGSGDPALEELKNRLCAAQRKMIAAAVPGLPINELFSTGFEAVREKYPSYRRGHLGHSISLGPQTAEAPFIAPGETRPLEPGMILCIEVPCYVRGRGGFNIEDMVLITENGCEVLTWRTPHYL